MKAREKARIKKVRKPNKRDFAVTDSKIPIMTARTAPLTRKARMPISQLMGVKVTAKPQGNRILINKAIKRVFLMA